MGIKQKWPCRKGLKAGKNWRPSMVPAEELKKGIEEEKEHTNSSRMACRIALDHLAQDVTYYSKAEKAKKTK